MEPKRVLLVDDEPNLLRLLTVVLRSGGMDVTTAPTSAAALRLAASTRFDALVTDVSLEGMDGPALARRMAEDNPELLVIFISGYDADTASICAGFARCAFLQKPFPPRGVLTTLADLANGRANGPV